MEFSTIVKTEAKPLTSLQRVLDILSDFKWHTNTEFFQSYIQRYSARIFDLKEKGIDIERRTIDSGHYEFRIVPRPGTIDSAKAIMPNSWEPKFFRGKKHVQGQLAW